MIIAVRRRPASLDTRSTLSMLDNTQPVGYIWMMQLIIIMMLPCCTLTSLSTSLMLINCVTQHFGALTALWYHMYNNTALLTGPLYARQCPPLGSPVTWLQYIRCINAAK